jgi:two-component system, LytTR family, response regulator
MKKVRTLIVDDEALAREGVALLLRDDPDIELIGECDNGRDAVAEIRARRPDLVFLDIQMPQRSGLEVLEQLAGKERPAIIFVTAYDEHAVRAFELCAVDYLLKPFRDQRFRAAVERAKAQVRGNGYREVQLQAQNLIEQLQRLESPRAHEPRDPSTATAPARLVFKIDGAHVFIESRDIAWIEAQGDFIKLRVNDRTLSARESLQGVEKRLDPDRFVRVHRSFIVNVARISKISPALYGDHVILTNDGAKIRLSRTYRHSLKHLLAPRGS